MTEVPKRTSIDRRDALRYLLAAGAMPFVSSLSQGGDLVMESMKDAGARQPAPDRMPTIFLAHGSPFLLDDSEWVGELAAWSRALPRPRAILMVSAHWEARPVTLGATTTVPLIYDFYGFPARYYEVTYPAPGAPELAAGIRSALARNGSVLDAPDRGLDHGAYVPLVAMYPKADIPVLQLSLPTLEGSALFRLGRELAFLRDEGVLIVGSGFITHNLRTLDVRPNAPAPGWASDFDAWVTDALAAGDVDSLNQYRSLAPGVRESLPTHEHFVPLLVSAGAAGSDIGEIQFPITGWMAGSFTKRSVQFG